MKRLLIGFGLVATALLGAGYWWSSDHRTHILAKQVIRVEENALIIMTNGAKSKPIAIIVNSESSPIPKDDLAMVVAQGKHIAIVSDKDDMVASDGNIKAKVFVDGKKL